MTATMNQNDANIFYKFLILMIIIGTALVVIGTLADLPMTRHAEQGRTGTTMDANTIRHMIDKRECKPIEFYVCPPALQSKAICYIKSTQADELWAGVIVGINPPHPIITGYVAPYYDYWMPANMRDGCYMTSRMN